ncbi:MAG: DUF1559 domain-containing protein [Isosphaeraceae bacterium]|nr:DUF1559 domain-containing protein [Isosphaeraceae bacterium]
MRSRPGFTLVELLVVITIIGVLIGLLLPAVQAAREAARRGQCINNLKQLAQAAHSYQDVQGTFPSCLYQPQAYTVGRRAWNNASWLVLMLPYLEQQPLHDAVNFSVMWGSTPILPVVLPGWDPKYYGEQNATVRNTSIDVFACPSDPSPRNTNLHADEIRDLSAVGTSYVGNMGSNCLDPASGFPCQSPALGDVTGGNGIYWRQGSRVSNPQILDGLSNTAMIGEQIMAASQWNAWVHANQSLGSTALPLNYAHQPPSSLWTWTSSFRSSHPGGADFALCDGSVRFVHDSIAFAVYQALSTRAGGEMLSADSF